MTVERSPGAEDGLSEDIVRRLGRRQSTAVVLFNHAVAERLGLGPTDHKCLDLLFERGAMTGSELAVITGLTTGAVTGVVARLERAGYLRRAPDPHDRRKQVLSPVPDRLQEIGEVFAPFHSDIARLLEGFDAHQLTAVAEFLDHSTDCLLRHAVLLRANAIAPRVSDRSGAPPTAHVAIAQGGATR